MTAFIIYNDGQRNIRELCANNIDLMRSNILIPHIGETFIDKTRDIEYEVKDIVRTYNLVDDQYGVQVVLKRREMRKYQ